MISAKVKVHTYRNADYNYHKDNFYFQVMDKSLFKVTFYAFLLLFQINYLKRFITV